MLNKSGPFRLIAAEIQDLGDKDTPEIYPECPKTGNRRLGVIHHRIISALLKVTIESVPGWKSPGLFQMAAAITGQAIRSRKKRTRLPALKE